MIIKARWSMIHCSNGPGGITTGVGPGFGAGGVGVGAGGSQAPIL